MSSVAHRWRDRKRRTLSSTASGTSGVWKAIQTRVVCLAAILFGISISILGTSILLPVEAIAPPAEELTKSERLIERFHCWTGEAPSGIEMPGHVIVTVHGRVRRGGPILVGNALDMVFNGTPSKVQAVHAFCP